MADPQAHTPAPVAIRDLRLARVANLVACLYFAWLFGLHWRNTEMFGKMYEGLGAELPLLTRIVVQQGAWLFPLLFTLFAGGVLAKERFIADKRFSLMVTFLLTLVGQFVAQALMTAYYLPFFDLVRKLS